LSRVELPAPPDWLTAPAAVDEWHRAGSLLAACGILPDSALTCLAHYCALHGSIVAGYQRGEIPDPSTISQLRLLASSLNLVGTRALPAATTKPNRFAKFKRPPEERDDG
jgi:hypothetical protein